MKRIVLTAFGQFGEHATNPTQYLLENYAWKLPNAQLFTKVWTVDFALVQRIYPLWLDIVKPDLIINLGLKASATGLELEQYAHNTSLDLNFNPIIDNNIVRYETDLELSALVDKLSSKGIPSSISPHAGTYLCNFMYFYSLRYALQHRKKALFVHCPYTTELMAKAAQQRQVIFPSLPAKMLHKGIQTILKMTK